MTSSASPGEPRPGSDFANQTTDEAFAVLDEFVWRHGEQDEKKAVRDLDVELRRLREQRDAVLALHYRTVDSDTATDYVSCGECCGDYWPCGTARALGVSE